MPNEEFSSGEFETNTGSSADDYGVDQDIVDKIKAEALIQAGYSSTGDDGAVRASIKQLQFAVLQVMQEGHVASGKRDLATSAVTQFELYQQLLPDGPGVQTLARSDEEKLAQQQLTKLLWSYANVGISGFVQKNVAGLGMVLCEAKVPRTKLNEETRTKQHTLEIGRFLTTDGELIMTYYTGPAGAAFVRAARKLDAQLGLVSDRRPELTMSVAKQLGGIVKQAVTAIPHADPKAAAALTAGNDPTDEQSV
jgi:hypothetical protein